MPEIDILHGLERQLQNAHEHGMLLIGLSNLCRGTLRLVHNTDGLGNVGHLCIYPRIFAEGTDRKRYSTASFKNMGYTHDLEPVPDGYSPHPHDAARSKGQPWEPFLKPFDEGDVSFAMRGKELVMAAGYVRSPDYIVSLIYFDHSSHSLARFPHSVWGRSNWMPHLTGTFQ